jgi:hypothetical protein
MYQHIQHNNDKPHAIIFPIERLCLPMFVDGNDFLVEIQCGWLRTAVAAAAPNLHWYPYLLSIVDSHHCRDLNFFIFAPFLWLVCPLMRSLVTIAWQSVSINCCFTLLSQPVSLFLWLFSFGWSTLSCSLVAREIFNKGNRQLISEERLK